MWVGLSRSDRDKSSRVHHGWLTGRGRRQRQHREDRGDRDANAVRVRDAFIKAHDDKDEIGM